MFIAKNHYLNQWCPIVIWTPKHKSSVIFQSKHKTFHSRKCIWKCCLQMLLMHWSHHSLAPSHWLYLLFRCLAVGDRSAVGPSEGADLGLPSRTGVSYLLFSFSQTACQVPGRQIRTHFTTGMLWKKYCQISNTRHTKSENLNVPCLILQLS